MARSEAGAQIEIVLQAHFPLLSAKSWTNGNCFVVFELAW